MRCLVAVAVAVMVMTAGPGCCHSPRSSSVTAQEFPASQMRVPGEYIVTLAAGVDVKVITNVYGRFGIKRIQDLGRNIFLVTLSEDPNPAQMEELRRQDARIEAVQPNFVYRNYN